MHLKTWEVEMNVMSIIIINSNGIYTGARLRYLRSPCSNNMYNMRCFIHRFTYITLSFRKAIEVICLMQEN